MDRQGIEKFVNDLTAKAFEKLQYAYDISINGKSDIKAKTRLRFKKYRNGEFRVSEQELRFAFVESLYEFSQSHEYESIYYSIETPTRCKYDFKDNPKVSEDGRSGNFDLTLYEDEKSIALIEFKAKNVVLKEIKKDYVKLSNQEEGDGDTLRYFIWIFENTDLQTKKSTDEKISKIEDENKLDNGCNVTFVRYSLSEKTDFPNIWVQ
jgi:cellobiose phosphorylase